MPVIIVDTLCNLYSKLFYAVRWNGKLFAHFTVCSGVDRAAVSHAIFNVFTNVFIMQLKRQGIGCCISSMFLGCILYADDILLLSPTVAGLKKMLDKCSEIAEVISLEFNVEKSL